MPTSEPIFVGIDLTDPFAKRRRKCTRAVLGMDLHCTFDEWEYDLSGSLIVPPELERSLCIVAIDGPQGLAGDPARTMRLCEQQLRAAGKSGYDFKTEQPYAGFVRGSVTLFHSLYQSGIFHLYGMEQGQEPGAKLIEVYPGAAWPWLAGQRLKKKKVLEGRRDRCKLMVRLGVTFAERYTIKMPPTHDQLDAAVASYIAYLFNLGKTYAYGQKPFEDTSRGILREGLIFQPIP